MTTIKRDTKPTKKEMLNELKNVLNGEAIANEKVTPEYLLEFIEKEIASLNKKAETSKANRDKKKTEDDELTVAVFNCLNGNEFITTPQILKQIDDEDVTHAKVTARLTKLVKAGRVEKDQVSVQNSDGKYRKLTGYKIADEVVETVED